MTNLLISNNIKKHDIEKFLKNKKNDTWVFLSWTSIEFPGGFETFNTIIIDFTGIEEIRSIEYVHLKLMNNIPPALEIGASIFCICGSPQVELYSYDPSLEDYEKNNSGSIYSSGYEKKLMNTYDIFPFSEDDISFKKLPVLEDRIQVDSYPDELENYLRNTKTQAHVYFDFKSNPVDVFAYCKHEKHLPVSFRTWYKNGELIFLPGYNVKEEIITICHAITSIGKLKSKPQWFLQFKTRNYPKLYKNSKNNLMKMDYICEMVYKTGDFPLNKKNVKNDFQDNLTSRVLYALKDILSPLGGTVSVSSSIEDGEGVDLFIKINKKIIMVQIKGLENKVYYKDIASIINAKKKYPQRIALFIANTHRLQSFDQRIKMLDEMNFDADILTKDFGVIRMTIIDLFLLWKATIDLTIEREKVVNTLLSWETSKILNAKNIIS